MSPAPAPPRRPDASMTLLREVMERPLDPGYAAAAARRRDGAPARARTAPTTVALAVVAGLLTVVGVVTLRAPAAEGTVEALLAEAEQRQERVGELAEEVAGARTAVRDAESAVLGAGPVTADARLELASGAVLVSGPGLVVTVEDAPTARPDASGSPRTDAAASAGRVRDRDLQVVVNGLWTAGAEAVAVNGQRLTSRTAIRGAGEAVLVGYQPLTPPYEVEAIGDSRDLATGFARSAGGRYSADLSEYGISVDVEEVQDLELASATGAQPEVARVLRPGEDPAPTTTAGEDP